jgi:Piezo non-specific cation channel, R-Ras-binding domain
VWYEEMPNPEVMFVLIDAIEMARMQKDFLKEDILYFSMVELLRNPEDLKLLTGSMLKYRLKIFEG